MIRGRATPPAPAVAAAAVVFLPYAAAGLPHRHALWLEATLILAAVLVLLAVGISRESGVWRVAAAERHILLGTGLYAAAAIIATAVGLARGNDPALVVGQLLSMGLLPAAAVAGLAFPDPVRRSFWPGVALAGAGAALVHLAAGAGLLVAGRGAGRLSIGGGIAATAAAPIAFFAAVLISRRPEWRRAGPVAAAVIAVYVAGAGTRSLWIAMTLGLGVLALMSFRRPRLLLPATAAVAGAVALFAVASLAAGWYLGRPRPDLLAPDPLGGLGTTPRPGVSVSADTGPGVQDGSTLSWSPPSPAWATVLPYEQPVAGSGSFRFAARVRGRGSGGFVALQWVGPDGVDRRTWLCPVPPDGAWHEVDWIGVRPRGTVSVRLVVGGDDGSWQLFRPRLVLLSSAPLAASSLRTWRSLTDRLRSLVPLGTHSVAADPTVALRLGETRALWSRFVAGSVASKVVGHGLGATFAFDTVAPDDAGVWRSRSNPNYIHNFYMFLLYKLGVAGGLVVLGAIALWMTPVLRLRRTTPEAAAAVTVWVTVLAWSVACPEVIDFRAAPLLGLLLAAGAALPPTAGAVTAPRPPSATLR